MEIIIVDCCEDSTRKRVRRAIYSAEEILVSDVPSLSCIFDLNWLSLIYYWFNEVQLPLSLASHAPFIVSIVRGEGLRLQWGEGQREECEKLWKIPPPSEDVGNIYLTDRNVVSFIARQSYIRSLNTHTTITEFRLPRNVLQSPTVILAAFRGPHSSYPKCLIKRFTQWNQFFSEERGRNSASRKMCNLGISLYRYTSNWAILIILIRTSSNTWNRQP